MKVRELIEQLKKHDPEMRIVTPRVEDYGESGCMEDVTMSKEVVYGSEEAAEDNYEGEDVLMICASMPKET